MRWARLFADLEAQLQAEESADLAGEIASRTRYEVGQLTLAGRFRANVGYVVQLSCAATGEISGTLLEVGAGWLLVDEGRGREVLVNLDAVDAVHGVGQQSVTEPETAVTRRLDLRYAIRGLARDRSAVRVSLTSGQSLTGTFDRVGADFAELAEHAADELRRPADVLAVRLIALRAIVAVRTLLQ